MARPLWRGVPSASAYWDLMYSGGSAVSLTTLTITDEEWAEGGGEPLEVGRVPIMWDTCPAFLPQAQAKYRHVLPAILDIEWPDHSPVDVTEGQDLNAAYTDIWCGPFILWDDSAMESRMFSETNRVEYLLYPEGRILEYGHDPYGIVEDRTITHPWEALNVDYLNTDLANAVDEETTLILNRLQYDVIEGDLWKVCEHMSALVEALTTTDAIQYHLHQQAQDWTHMLEGRNDPCSSSQLLAQPLRRLAS